MWNRIPGTRAFIPSLGLAFPCRFLEGGRCRIYPVRPLGCRLFPEGLLVDSSSVDLTLYRGTGYRCFDEGLSVSRSQRRLMARLLSLQREEAGLTARLFQNSAYLHVLSPAELQAIARDLEGVPPEGLNERRRNLCTARIPQSLRGQVEVEFRFQTG